MILVLDFFEPIFDQLIVIDVTLHLMVITIKLSFKWLIFLSKLLVLMLKRFIRLNLVYQFLVGGGLFFRLIGWLLFGADVVLLEVLSV